MEGVHFGDRQRAGGVGGLTVGEHVAEPDRFGRAGVGPAGTRLASPTIVSVASNHRLTGRMLIARRTPSLGS